MARQTRGDAPRAAAAKRKGGSPLLTGLVIGVLLGLGAALGVALYLARGPSPFAERKPAEPAAAKPATPPAPRAETASGPAPLVKDDRDSLQFHEILRGQKDGRESAEIKPGPAPAPAATDVWFLQVASLSSAADADTLKVQLALSGFEPRIQSVQIEGGRVVHRVRLGPFASARDAEDALVDVKRKNQLEGRIVKEKQPAPNP